MTESSILRKYTGRPLAEGGDPDITPEVELTDDLGAFGWLRGSRERAIMLELRKKDGNILAIGYGWLERMAFDRSDGITLYAAGQKIRIKGRNLNTEIRPNVQLFGGIARHRVPFIQEADQASKLEASERATIIEAIEW
jgi:hypothetical protein